MATLEDIAKKVGVSKSTVSKALNGAGDVSDAMRRLVLEAAVEFGYSRLRRSDDTPKLAIFITNMEYTKRTDFGYDIIVGFRKMAEPEGFLAEIIPLTIEMEENNRYEEYMMQHNYRGAVFLRNVEIWVLERLRDSINCSRYFATSAYSSFKIVYRFVMESTFRAPKFLYIDTAIIASTRMRTIAMMAKVSSTLAALAQP